MSPSMFRTPSSSTDASPLSSPPLDPVDSSPPSSPRMGEYSLDPPSPSNSPLSHPFAGSTKVVKRHPDYEKKTVPLKRPPSIFSRVSGLSRVAARSRSLVEDDFVVTSDCNSHPIQLKNIPPSIGDLSGFFNTPEVSEQMMFSGRTLARVNTEPSRTCSFGRTQSIADSGKQRHLLQLYLSGNKISYLPPQLFTLQYLSVLSLRGNRLTYLPGEICRLKNLKELNISLNRLTYLPWEIRDMKLDKLLVYPNPFLPEPSSPFKLTDSGAGHWTPSTRWSITRLASVRGDSVDNSPSPAAITVSPIVTLLDAVPPLTELCLRLLLTPVGEGFGARTVIAGYYDVPLSDQWNIPLHIHSILTESVPGIIRLRKRFSMDAPSMGSCQRSVSQQGIARWANPKHWSKMFIGHAVERFTWERYIAGMNVGGTVPLRWKGCMQTCLGFLDQERLPGENVRTSIGVVDATLNDGDAMEIDLAEAVPVFQLGRGGLSMADFDD
ncbi:hypothetical protein M404DRAFT_996066 [Pisolithus tinctorius Marx 270]|uniref:Uncharacterized protein n=1 Tax=Pisolithus tinctorius Marx 270 TaxID=870435 RepID=A0A0C3PNU9_PISTI|nr:hypothetical protein M404DRAFT_996066 [Pisolithus tinctorius Marx 270]